MKILKGRYEPVVGLSTDLTAIIARCLSQAAARRPSAERLLSLPCVRAKAAEFGIELPACVQGGPLASPGGSFILGEGGSPRKRSMMPSLQAAADARRLSIGAACGSGRPTARRATCPHSPAQMLPGMDRPPRLAVGRRSTLHIAFEGRRLSVVERHNLRTKAPLPAVAVPRSRLTELAAAAACQPLQGSLQGELAVQPQGVPASSTPAAPLQAGAAAAVMAATATVAASLLGPPPVPTPQAAALPSLPRTLAARQATPRRHSHFSVNKHMQARGGAAQPWLAQFDGLTGSSSEGRLSEAAASPGQSPDAGWAACAAVPAAAHAVAVAVERSAVSDSVLLVAPRRPAEQAEAQAEAAPLTEASAVDGEEGERGAMLAEMRRRCVALLGSEQAFQELYSLARSAVVEGSGGSGEGSGTRGAASAPRPATMAALADALFARAGYTSDTAEALHLLMRMLAVE